MLNDADLENNWNDVILLLPFNSNFIDLKKNYGPTSTTGATVVTTNTYDVKYGVGAARFNGNLDTLRYQHGTDTTIGTGDFTLELWVKPNRFGTDGGGANSAGLRGIFANHTVYSTGTTSRTLILRLVDEKLYLEVAGIALGGFAELTKDRWAHVAVCRESANLRFFVDGELVHTYTGASYNFSTNTFVLGGTNYAASGNNWGYYAGFIDDFRFTKGFARYTQEFSPPAAAYPAGNTVRTPVNFFPQVRLLAESGIENISFNQRQINANRNPPSLSYQVPFFNDTVAYYFNRSPITTFPDDDFRVGMNDFTIEAWVNIESGSGLRTICASYGYPTRQNFWFGTVNNTLQVRIGLSSNVANNGTYSDSLTPVDADYIGRIQYNQWTHVAWSRRGSTNRIFINGKIARIFNNATNWSSSTITFGHRARTARQWRSANLSIIWGDLYQEGDWFVGYMNDIKFSNRVCKYTGNFNPMRGVVNDRPVEFSKFDRNTVPTGNFNTPMVVRVDTDEITNNNVFWFNDDSGFILQKEASTAPGIRVNTAVVNSSNQLVITLTSGLNINLGNIIGQPDDVSSRLVGTGLLKSYDNGVFTFIPLTASGDVSILDINNQKVITSKDYSKGTSFDGMVRVSAFFEQGTSYIAAPVANTWTKIQLNTISNNTLGATLESDYSLILPAGTYYIVGDSVHYNGAHSSVKLIDETLGRDLIASSTDVFAAVSAVEPHIEGHFTLYRETVVSLQVFNTTASSGLAAPANGPHPQHNYMFFKVA